MSAHAPDTRDRPAEAPSVVFRQVTKRYPGADEPAVMELDLEVSGGEICVFVGPSGSGKTTAMRMVNRMVEITEGDILVRGTSVRERSPAELRREIGYVIQQIGLFPHRTVADNIATVPRLLGWKRQRIEARVEEMLELVRIDPELRERFPAQLSGGQQQRVGVARALAANPGVMLMDEPFGAVDPINRERLQNEFLRLQAEVRKTILFVTHDIDEAIKLGDQVAVLRVGGRLAQLADPAYLLAHPVDDFVADFVGRDRGYRALSFQPTPRLPLRPERTLTLGESAVGADGDWALVVDHANHPLGWVEPRRIDGEVTEQMLHRGGTVAKASGPLRAALDAALSSPSRRGVIVDDSGALAGTVRAHEVLTAIEEADRPEVADPLNPGAPAP